MPEPAPAPVVATDVRRAYLRTVVTVELPHTGRVSASVAAQELGPFHILTAYNPGDERPTAGVNRRANERLRLDLLLSGATVYPALGAAPDGSHQEPSLAAIGLTREQALSLGRRHRQAAIFSITLDEQRVLGCDGDWQLARPLGEPVD